VEEVTYTYDTLNRLARAETTGPEWGQAFAYDGFGNLTGKTVTKGAAPVLSAAYDPATNRGLGAPYDANGNPVISGASPGQLYYPYDVENRLVWGWNGGGLVGYGYDPWGKRWGKWSNTWSDAEYYFYGITGQKLMTVRWPQGQQNWGAPVYNVYFGGKLLRSQGVTVMTDRLGSVRGNGSGERMSYYPYGEERTATADGREKFGTYMRDNSTGLDYADQRYHVVGAGRFFTVDPLGLKGANLKDPASWNLYSYVLGDPINRRDPSGLTAYSCRWVEGAEGMEYVCYSEPTEPGDAPVPDLSEPASGGGPPDYSKTVQFALMNLRKSIDSNCLGWLESGIAGGDLAVFNAYYNALDGANGSNTALAGAQDLSKTDYKNLNAVTNGNGFSMGNGFVITVNTDGAFFTTNKGAGYGDKYDAEIRQIQGGTVQAQNFILIHELAHYFGASGFTQNDGGDLPAQKRNNDLLWDKCKATIRGPIL
jgi:RHS repeat-associated protein